jgi:hypothetical protein
MASRRQSSFNKAVNYIRGKHPDINVSHKQSEFNKAVQSVQKDIVAATKKTAKPKRPPKVRTNRSTRKEKAKLYRQSILPANANPIIDGRLVKAKVPNARQLYPPQLHLETGNFNFGEGFTERTFYGGAKLSSQTQAAQAKNILKRAKRLKKISVKAVAVATLGSVIASGINAKVTASKVPKGYKMVFGRLVKVRGE